MNPVRIIVVGGGAAGVFAAIRCAELAPDADVTVLERGPHCLSKVKISGGGRCNVTHACFDPRELAARFPRGGQALIGAFNRFQPRQTVAWFESRGVRLKTETDGRMFPVTDSSQTITDCLLNAARTARVKIVTGCAVKSISRQPTGVFRLELGNGGVMDSDRLLLATGGCRTPAGGALAVALGHTLEPPVPSLFTFHIETAWLRGLAGVSLDRAEVSVAGTRLCETGALLVTHWGLSGPAVLRLSAWGARVLNAADYRFTLRVNWLPGLGPEGVAEELRHRRQTHGARQLINAAIPPLPGRLWEQLIRAAGIPPETRWAQLSRSQQHQLAQQLLRSEFPVTGKSLNKDEFVTCGGVRLEEVNFKTMESRCCPHLYFAGELLDIDGITGGFNFQSAWTTGWIAGEAMARPAQA